MSGPPTNVRSPTSRAGLRKRQRAPARGMGVPRSTAASWLRRGPRAVVTLDVLTKDKIELQAEVIRLRLRNEVLSAIREAALMLLRLAGVRFGRDPHSRRRRKSQDPGRNRPSADDSAARSGVARSQSQRPRWLRAPNLYANGSRIGCGARRISATWRNSAGNLWIASRREGRLWC
jgi:hypothetical protein